MAQARQLAIHAVGYIAAVAIGGSSSIQGGINTSLAHHLTVGPGRCGNTSLVLLASLVSFCTGVASLLALNLAQFLRQWRRGTPFGIRLPSSALHCAGGLLGSSVMALSLTALPITGFAVTAVVRSAGTISCSLIFDQLGCIGMSKRKLTRQRMAGAALLLVGASL